MPGSAVEIIPARSEMLDRWAQMRHQLWPWDDARSHADEARSMYLSGNPGCIALIARIGERLVGFAEARLRHDYVEGCQTSPVCFLEGIFIEEDCRRDGLASRLCDHVASWAREQGCSEFASNALLENSESHAFHEAIGFEETERLVYFRREL